MGHGHLRDASRGLLDGLLAVLLAPACAACGRVLDQPTRGAVCEPCWAAVVTATPPVCDACGLPLPGWRAASLALGRCGRCRRLAHAVDRARTVGPYEGVLRAIVHALKYDGRRSVAPRLGALMAERAAELCAHVDVVVPVPLHVSRERRRGFNQAADLARAIGPPVVRALARVRATEPQVDLPAARRHANVRGAFAPAVAAGAAIAGRVVLLVDDVATTGATLDACAGVLKTMGAREVRAVTAARALTARPP